MPKKTKKQKILAELRRKLMKADAASSAFDTPKANFVKRINNTYSQAVHAPPPASLEFSKNIVARPKTHIDIVDYSHLKHDLIRITIFSLIALISQGVLYFVLRRG